MDEYRPKIIMPKTTLQKFANIIGYGFIFVSILYSIINLSSLPSNVPIHFDSSGEADGWGSKYVLFLLPLISVIMGLALEAVEKRPHLHNYPSHLNESNIQQYYAISIRTSNLVKNAILAIFGLLQIRIVQSTLQANFTLGATLVAFFIVAVSAPIIWHIVSISKIKADKED